MKVEVEVTWRELSPEKAEGRTAVIIDALRASSTIITALANGCRRVIPVTQPRQAFELLEKDSGRLLGGERAGKKIEGFHLGNSPGEYFLEAVKGKEVVLTTTNGTLAVLHAAKMAGRVLVASPLNAGALASYLEDEEEAVIVCAGLKGKFALEDFVTAGLLVEEINIRYGNLKLSKTARKAMNSYLNFSRNIACAFICSPHGRRLLELGLVEDIYFCSRKNVFHAVPVFDGTGLVLKNGA